MLTTLLGIPVGIACSLFAWWLLFHGIVPKIGFSDEISKTATDQLESGFRYRIKLRNEGRRDVVDVHLFARLQMKGINPDFPGNIRYTDVVVGTNRVPRFSSSGGDKVFHILVEETEEFQRPSFPEYIRRKKKDKTLLLEDVLNLGDESGLRIVMFAYDAFTGHREVIESKLYTLEDIEVGPFIRGELKIDRKDAV